MKLRRFATGLAVSIGSLVATPGIAVLARSWTEPGELVLQVPVSGVSRARLSKPRGLGFGNERPDPWCRITINSRRHPGDEVPETTPRGEIRVVCLGDPFVFGGGQLAEIKMAAVPPR